MAKKIRYAVIGCGWFAQAAVIPGLTHAGSSEVVALFSGDPVKRQKLGDYYKVAAHPYEKFDELAAAKNFDAVYIVMPNSLHHEWTLKAAQHGLHVLCEKPLAATVKEAEEMIEVCRKANVKFMTAYRLHFEEANLSVIDAIHQGKIGEPRLFSSVFTQQVKESNSRVHKALAGHPVMDVGVYCINAARYLFQDEPTEVMAVSASVDEPRFREVPEMVSVIMKFPKARLAQFTCGFGESAVSEYRIVGTTGDIRLDPGYGFDEALEMHATVQKKKSHSSYRKRDQVGAEIQYFSECIINNHEPEPNGIEGLADIKIVEAILQSIQHNGQPVKIAGTISKPRPTLEQQIHLSAVSYPDFINAEPPGGM